MNRIKQLTLVGSAVVALAAPSVSRLQSEPEKPVARIFGKVTFEGPTPKVAAIKMNADPFCLSAHATPVYPQNLVVGPDGGLQNVLVYVKQGLENRTFSMPSDTVRIEQVGCTYSPHVLGARAGQAVEIVNRDPTLHNIHVLSVKNRPFNVAQPVEGMHFTRVFRTAEVMVPIKCDVHPWMSAYLGVFDHPCFSVTSADGSFGISDLPPGDYMIEAWHETLGTLTQTVKLGEGDQRETHFVFKAKAAN